MCVCGWLGNFPDSVRFVEPLNFAFWLRCDSLADSELADRVRDDDLACVAKVNYPTGLANDSPVGIAGFFGWLTGAGPVFDVPVLGVPSIEVALALDAVGEGGH